MDSQLGRLLPKDNAAMDIQDLSAPNNDRFVILQPNSFHLSRFVPGRSKMSQTEWLRKKVEDII